MEHINLWTELLYKLFFLMIPVPIQNESLLLYLEKKYRQVMVSIKFPKALLSHLETSMLK